MSVASWKDPFGEIGWIGADNGTYQAGEPG
jgi:hypothetical protein